MRKATLLLTAILAVLALSVGALAYPVVVGIHPFSTAPPSAPAAVTHPKGDDNSTGNQTNDNETGDHEAPPAANETENETGDNETAPPPGANETENETAMNVSVEHDVTVVRMDNTTWVNGTIIVLRDNVTVADISFQIVVHDNGSANVTFNGTNTVGSTVVSVRGVALYDTESQTVDVFGMASATLNGALQWARAFEFELPRSAPS